MVKMKKKFGKILIIFIVTFFVLWVNVLYAGNGKVLSDKVTINDRELSKINSVALVSVYGECYLRGRRLYLYNDPKYAALEDFIKEKVSFVKNNTLNSNPLPFKFLDEQSVIASEQYKMILQHAPNNTGSTVEVDLSSLFKKKDKDDKTLIEVNPWPGYYVIKDYGVYLSNPLNQTIYYGNVPKERERLFREMGCDAIYSIGIKMTICRFGRECFWQRKRQDFDGNSG